MYVDAEGTATGERRYCEYGRWSVPVVNVGRRSSSETLLRRRWDLFFLLSTAICMMAQSSDDRYPVVRNGKVGFIDFRGNEVIAPQFFPLADMAHFRDDLAPVVAPDGAGYIDATGRFVIGPNRGWGQPTQFHEGIASVVVWGEGGAPNTPAFIDRTGRIVLSGVVQAYFAEGLMPLSDTRRWGFVDQSFHWVIPPKYEVAEEFSDGLAPVQIDGKWGYIDKAGDEIVPPKYDLAWPFSDGLGRVQIDIATGEKHATMEGPRSVYRHQLGFVDSNGKEVIHPQFESATNFQQDRAFVMLPGSRRLGMIDKLGNIVHEPEYEQTGEFHEDLAVACLNGKWGYVDTGGGWIIAPQFSGGGDFWRGLARVAWRGGYGYIDRRGTVVWKTTTK
jgi:hypothetical protein